MEDSRYKSDREIVKESALRAEQREAAQEANTDKRAQDVEQADEIPAVNSLEVSIEKLQQQLPAAEDTQRAEWLKKGQETESPKPQTSRGSDANGVESDEIFTATQPDVKPLVPAEIEQQYLRVGDKFYHPKNTELVAFEDKGNKLETKSNSEAIAESLVRIAEARGWDEIKVSGSETFRKEVWLEAAARGMQVKGYNPSEKDKAELAKRISQTETTQVAKDNKPFLARENEDAQQQKPRAESQTEATVDTPNKRMAQSFANEPAAEAVKKHPELAGAVAAVAAMYKKAEADGLSAAQRAIVMARVRQNVVNSIEKGDVPDVKIKEQPEASRKTNQDKEISR